VFCAQTTTALPQAPAETLADADPAGDPAAAAEGITDGGSPARALAHEMATPKTASAATRRLARIVRGSMSSTMRAANTTADICRGTHSFYR
jgi:hypothetical protein